MIVIGPSEDRHSSHREEDDHQAPVVDSTGNRMSAGALGRKHGQYSGEGADDPGRHMHRHDAQEQRRRRGDRDAKDDYAFARHGRLGAATALRLDGRARHAAVAAEHTAIPRLGLQTTPATGTIVKEHARVRRHRFNAAGAAVWAGDDAFQRHLAHLGGDPGIDEGESYKHAGNGERDPESNALALAGCAHRTLFLRTRFGRTQIQQVETVCKRAQSQDDKHGKEALKGAKLRHPGTGDPERDEGERQGATYRSPQGRQDAGKERSTFETGLLHRTEHNVPRTNAAA